MTGIANIRPVPPPPPLEHRESVDTEELLILRQLEVTRRRIATVEIVWRSLVLVAGLIAYGLLAAVLDQWVFPRGMPDIVRWLLWTVLVAAAAGWLVFSIGPYLIRRIHPVFAAYLMEQAVPGLKHSLMSFVMLRRDKDELRNDPLRLNVFKGLEHKTAEQVSRVAPDVVVDRSSILHAAYGLAALIAVFAVLIILSPKNPLTSALRAMLPWSPIPAPSRVRIEMVQPGNAEVVQGDRVVVSAMIYGLREGEAPRVIFSTADGQLTDQIAPLAAVGDGGPRFECELFPAIQQTTTYRILAGDAITPEYRLAVVIPLRVKVRQVEYHFPEYTKLEPRTVENLGDIQAIEGTEVVIHAESPEALRRAELVLEGDQQGVLPMAVTDRAATARKRLRLTKPGSFLREFSVYHIRAESQTGRPSTNPVKYTIEVVPDMPPVASWLEPTETTLTVPVNWRVPLRLKAADPDFGLRQIVLTIESLGQKLTQEVLLEKPRGEAHTGEFLGSYEFDPAKLNLAAGDVALCRVTISDNREPTPNVVSLPELQIRIGGPEQGGPPPQERQGDQRAEQQPGDRPQQGAGQKPEGQGQKPEGQPQPPSPPPQGSTEQKPRNGDPENQTSQQMGENAGQNTPAGNAGQQSTTKAPNAAQGNQPSQSDQQAPTDPASGEKASRETTPQDQGQDMQKPTEGARADGQQQTGAQPQPSGGQDQQSGGQSGSAQPQAGQGRSRPEGPQTGSGETGGSDQQEMQNQQNQAGPTDREQNPASPNNQPGQGDAAGQGESSQPPDGTQQPGATFGQQGMKGSPDGADQGQGPSEPPASPDSPQGGRPDGARPSASGGAGSPGSGQERQPASPNQQETAPSSSGATPGQPNANPQGGAESNDNSREGSESGAQAQGQSNPRVGEGPPQQTTPQGGPGAQPTPQGSPTSPQSASEAGSHQDQGQGADRAGEKVDGVSNPGDAIERILKYLEQKRGDSTPQSGTPCGRQDCPICQGTPNPACSGGRGSGQKPGGSSGSPPSGSGDNPESPSVPAGPSSQAPTGQPKPATEGPGSNDNASGQPPGSSDLPSRQGDRAPQDAESGSESVAPPAPGGPKPPQNREGMSGEQAGSGGQGGGQNVPAAGSGGPGSQSPSDSPSGSLTPGEGSESGPSGGSPAVSSGGQQGEGQGQTSGADGQGTQTAQGGNQSQAGPGGGMPQPADGAPRGGGIPGGGAGGGGAWPGTQTPIDDPNLEFARRQTELVLRHLEQELAKQNPDEALLRELGWTKEEMAEFVRRWQELKKAAEDSTPQGKAAQRRLNEILRSLGLRPSGTELRRNPQSQDSVRGLETGRDVPPPPQWSDFFKEYLKSLGANR